MNVKVCLYKFTIVNAVILNNPKHNKNDSISWMRKPTSESYYERETLFYCCGWVVLFSCSIKCMHMWAYYSLCKNVDWLVIFTRFKIIFFQRPKIHVHCYLLFHSNLSNKGPCTGCFYKPKKLSVSFLCQQHYYNYINFLPVVRFHWLNHFFDFYNTEIFTPENGSVHL